jgi:hypothetical protein
LAVGGRLVGPIAEGLAAGALSVDVGTAGEAGDALVGTDAGAQAASQSTNTMNAAAKITT